MYVYRFLNDKEEVIYIGRTIDILDRINNHSHLPEGCYKETKKIQYLTLLNNNEARIYEIYLINLYNPKYNIQYKEDSKFNFTLPIWKWNDFNCEFTKEGSLKESLVLDNVYLLNKDDIKFVLSNVSEFNLFEIDDDFYDFIEVKNSKLKTYLNNVNMGVLFFDLDNNMFTLKINQSKYINIPCINNSIIKKLNRITNFDNIHYGSLEYIANQIINN